MIDKNPENVETVFCAYCESSYAIKWVVLDKIPEFGKKIKKFEKYLYRQEKTLQSVNEQYFKRFIFKVSQHKGNEEAKSYYSALKNFYTPLYKQ